MVTAGDGNLRARYVLLPLFAQGHQIPMADFAVALAARGEAVSFVTTPANSARLHPTIDHARRRLGLSIDVVVLPLATEKAGLPPGCENVDLIPLGETTSKLYLTARELERPLKEYLHSLKPHPTCLVADFTFTWTVNVARELNIRRYVFYSIGCFSLYSLRRLPHYFDREGIEQGDRRLFPIPGIPHHVEITRDQGHGWANMPRELARLRQKEMEDGADAADGIVVNTLLDAEPMYVKLYGELMGKTVWPVGPLCLHNATPALRGAVATVEVGNITSWLDGKDACSVVYVCLGSITRLTTAQHVEIGLALEATGRPFVWVVKAKEKQDEVEEWLAAGFEERNRGRGLVVRGWAPQMTILLHPAVAAFVTHCGWNSVVEGLATGVPMVTWPWFADQFLNERFVVDVVGTGVAVGAKVPRSWWVYDDEKLVRREAIATAVERVMGGGEEAEERRRKARELREAARNAVQAAGSSNVSVEAFVKAFKCDSSSSV